MNRLLFWTASFGLGLAGMNLPETRPGRSDRLRRKATNAMKQGVARARQRAVMTEADRLPPQSDR